MTKDRDFKNVVRKRSAKTGESYQAAKRQLERQTSSGLFGHVYALWEHPAGLVLGLHVEAGQVAKGMPVTVSVEDRVLHEGTVASLRIGKQDQPVAGPGDCGIILDPPFHGVVAIEPTEESVPIPGALKPVEVAALPWTVTG